MYPYNRDLTKYAKELRKNMTREEKHLWYDFLKLLPMTVKRQYVVGCYILDFFIPSVNIAIELDGSQHYEKEAREKDSIRDEYLKSLNTKLQEEMNEYLESGDIEELADLEEVLRAILDAKNVSYENFENTRTQKQKKRGAFKNKIFLEWVDEYNE